jgi:hypothetical protein
MDAVADRKHRYVALRPRKDSAVGLSNTAASHITVTCSGQESKEEGYVTNFFAISVILVHFELHSISELPIVDKLYANSYDN